MSNNDNKKSLRPCLGNDSYSQRVQVKAEGIRSEMENREEHSELSYPFFKKKHSRCSNSYSRGVVWLSTIIIIIAAVTTELVMSSFTLYGWAVCSWALINAFQVSFFIYLFIVDTLLILKYNSMATILQP